MARIVYCIGIILLVLTSCTPTAVREAQATIATADSLRAEGVSLSDSAALAEAVSSLCPWRYLYRDDYARANYYYGRYLRSVGNQPAAMQCFIDATHSHSHDYEILGRVYANMGNMCRLGKSFDLSNDMCDNASMSFLSAGDTLLYFYSLNDKAVNYALDSCISESLYLIDTISHLSANEQLNQKLLETKAIAFRHSQQYDSAIYYAHLIQVLGNFEPTGYMIKAISYSSLGQQDSAIYYAHNLADNSHDLPEKYNALYILSHHDTSISKDSVLTLTSARADLQMEYTRRQESLAQAIQLLQQDLSRKPNYYRWIIVLILIICTCMGICYIILQHRRGTLLSFYSKRIAYENKELSEQNQQLYKQREQQVLHACETLCSSPNWKNLISWNDYAQMCDNVDLQFFRLATKLQQKNILNEKELRLCILVLLDIPHREIANILTYSESGIGKYKYSIAKKLGVNSKNLRTFLMDLAVKM